MTETEETVELEHAELFDLDENNLVRHWLDQSKLVWKYGQELADAKRRVDWAKAKADVINAETSAAITKNPEQHGLTKTTVNAIAAAVALSPKVIEANKAIIRHKHRVDILQAMMVALDNRKRALEGLVSLHGQQYFAKPQADATGQEVLQKEAKHLVRQKHRQRRSKG